MLSFRATHQNHGLCVCRGKIIRIIFFSFEIHPVLKKLIHGILLQTGSSDRNRIRVSLIEVHN